MQATSDSRFNAVFDVLRDLMAPADQIDTESNGAILRNTLCGAYPGFPTKDRLPDYCAREGTHLAGVKEEVAIALLMRSYLSTMEAMHVTYGTGLVDFKEERFLRFLPSNSGS